MPPNRREACWREWLLAAEGGWCRSHELRGQARASVVGRVSGLELRLVSLGARTMKSGASSFF